PANTAVALLAPQRALTAHGANRLQPVGFQSGTRGKTALLNHFSRMKEAMPIYRASLLTPWQFPLLIWEALAYCRKLPCVPLSVSAAAKQRWFPSTFPEPPSGF